MRIILFVFSLISATINVTVTIVAILLVWAAIMQIDEIARGEGKVIPSRQLQIIQSLESENRGNGAGGGPNGKPGRVNGPLDDVAAVVAVSHRIVVSPAVSRP